MIPLKIFSYWESINSQPIYPYIKYCITSIQQRKGADIEFILLTPENIDKYLDKSLLNENWRKITNIAQKVDCLRLAVLYQHGGMWFDLDTILLKSPMNIFNICANYDISIMKWTFNGRTLNGYFLAKQNSEFLKIALREVNRILTEEPKCNYTEAGGVYLGENIFKFTEAHFPTQGINLLPLSTFIPVEFPHQREIWYKLTEQPTVQNYIHPHTISIALNNSQYPENFRRLDMFSHIASKNFFADIIKYSEKLGTLLPVD